MCASYIEVVIEIFYHYAGDVIDFLCLMAQCSWLDSTHLGAPETQKRSPEFVQACSLRCFTFY